MATAIPERDDNRPPGMASESRSHPAPRFNLPAEQVVRANDLTAQLVNVSVTGAQILSPTRIRPNQHLNLVLDYEGASLQLAGVVVWSKLELRHGTEQYRAGLNFSVPSPELYACVIRAHLME